MNPISKIWMALASIARHPVNKNRKLRAVAEYGFIQMAARLIPGEVCLEFPNHTRLLISPSMKGAAHFIAPRLCEFAQMSFVMHFLRADELFADVGANLGSFSVMAAGVAGARVVAFEPSPDIYDLLERNIRLNALQARIRAVNAAVGRQPGTARFSTGLGTENHVFAAGESENSVATRVTTLDSEMGGTAPVLLKVDVEGFELEVFAGASQTLQNPALQAIIVERDNSGNRYGHDESALHVQIRSQGFVPYAYKPLERKLELVDNDATGISIIYLRNLPDATRRVQNATPYQLGDLRV